MFMPIRHPAVTAIIRYPGGQALQGISTPRVRRRKMMARGTTQTQRSAGHRMSATTSIPGLSLPQNGTFAAKRKFIRSFTGRRFVFSMLDFRGSCPTTTIRVAQDQPTARSKCGVRRSSLHEGLKPRRLHAERLDQTLPESLRPALPKSQRTCCSCENERRQGCLLGLAVFVFAMTPPLLTLLETVSTSHVCWKQTMDRSSPPAPRMLLIVGYFPCSCGGWEERVLLHVVPRLRRW